MKYLIIRDLEGMEFPVFCLAPLKHEQMATAWRRDEGMRVVSAGFVEFGPAGVRTFGYSDSLNLYPRPQDARLIATFYKVTLELGANSAPAPLQHTADVLLHRTA